jgi:hypothetical protein
MSKERRKGNHPALPTLPLYTIHLPPSNHSSCSNIPSESHPMILHTTTITPYQYNYATLPDVATPRTTSLSYQIVPPLSHCILRIFQRLRLSVIQYLAQHPRIPIIVLKYLCTSLNCNSIPFGGLGHPSIFSNGPGFRGYHWWNSSTYCWPSTIFAGSEVKQSYLVHLVRYCN